MCISIHRILHKNDNYVIYQIKKQFQYDCLYLWDGKGEIVAAIIVNGDSAFKRQKGP